MSSTLTTHVLDLAQGTPAAGVVVALYRVEGDTSELVGRAETSADGRPPPFESLEPGSYELTFAAGAYFERTGSQTLYDEIPVRFGIVMGQQKYHIPLLLAPWGYSTYRGS
jgi:5-hydroxyisourate hydrolase